MNVRARCSSLCVCIAFNHEMALIKYVQREGPVLRCDALSRKETEHVNERMRQALMPGEQAKVGLKRSATRGSYTGYTPDERERR